MSYIRFIYIGPKSDKYMKVVFEGTTITLELSMTDLNKPYIGHKSGLEFTWQQKL